VLAYSKRLSYTACAAALGGAMTLSPAATRADAAEEIAPPPPPPAATATNVTAAEPAPAPEPTGDSCLTKTICAVKEKIRWQTPAWTPSQCRRISDAVSASAKKYDLSSTLLLAIMINESDMNERATQVYKRGGKVYAKDAGLMAIRCHIDSQNRCTNGEVRGLSWKKLMDPVTNIEIGARMLAHYRDGGAVMEKTVTRRDGSGHLHRVTKEIPCSHKNHAFWAHYNHGPRYIDKGYPRHYPHRIAVLDHALATVMNLPTPELSQGRITIRDPGKRERTPDRPLEPRYKKLTGQILSSGTCSALALN